ncbi:hypothetical protein PFISCL1PPCAC_9840, partial [Pristionchus fissidentatus]
NLVNLPKNECFNVNAPSSFKQFVANINSGHVDINLEEEVDKLDVSHCIRDRVFFQEKVEYVSLLASWRAFVDLDIGTKRRLERDRRSAIKIKFRSSESKRKRAVELINSVGTQDEAQYNRSVQSVIMEKALFPFHSERAAVWKRWKSALREGKVKCHLCPDGISALYKGFAEFSSHLQSEHSQATVRLFACGGCNEAFRTHKLYDDHVCSKKPKMKCEEMTIGYLGLVCAECGLSSRLSTGKGTDEEWKDLCKLMSHHSQTHLVPMLVLAARPLTTQPQLRQSMYGVAAKLDNEEKVACPHCETRVNGDIELKKHLLEGKCSSQLSSTRLAFAVRIGAEGEKEEEEEQGDDVRAKLENLQARKKTQGNKPLRELDRESEYEAYLKRVETGVKSYDFTEVYDEDEEGEESGGEKTVELLRDMVSLSIKHVPSAEADAIAARFAFRTPITLPIQCKASDARVEHMPRGLRAGIYACEHSLLLVGGDNAAAAHVCSSDGCKRKLEQVSWPVEGLENARILCPRCPSPEKQHSLCSVLALQAHLSTVHNLHYRVDDGMEQADDKLQSATEHMNEVLGIPKEGIPLKDAENKQPRKKRSSGSTAESYASMQSDSSLAHAHNGLSTTAADETESCHPSTTSTTASTSPSSSPAARKDSLKMKIVRDPITKACSIPESTSPPRERQDSVSSDEGGGLVIDEGEEEEKEQDEPMDTTDTVEGGAAAATVIPPSEATVSTAAETVERQEVSPPSTIDASVQQAAAAPVAAAASELGADGQPAGPSGLNQQNSTPMEEDDNDLELMEAKPLPDFGAPPRSDYLPKEDFFYLCRICMTVMPNEAEFFEAHRGTHSAKEQELQSCDCCSYMTPSGKKRQKHVADHNQLRFNCSRCKLVFVDDSQYYRHCMQKHGRDLIYFCKKCNIATKSLQKLADHINDETCKNIPVRYMRDAMPGVIAECFLTFVHGLQQGEFGRAGKIVKLCQTSDCVRRSLIAPDEDELAGGDESNREERRTALFTRVSCPIDNFPIPFDSYAEHENDEGSSKFFEVVDNQLFWLSLRS